MKFKTIPEMFVEVCDYYKDTKAAFKYKLNDEYIPVTHQELREKVECFALGLLNLGIKKGDRIGIVSENRIEWAIVDLAIACIGAVDVPIYTTLTPKQEQFIFNDCSASAVVVSNQFQLNKILEVKPDLPSLRHIIVINEDFKSDDVAVKSMNYIINRGSEIRSSEERKKILKEYIDSINENDLLTIIYTSGTTGNPKGVMLTHKNVVSNVKSSVQAVDFKETDRFLTYLPWCHSYERTTGYYSAFSAGATIAFVEAIETISTNIKEFKPTYMTTVPKLLEKVRKRIYSNMEQEPKIKQRIFNWAVDVGVDYVRAYFGQGANPIQKLNYKLADRLVFSKIRDKIGVETIKFVSGGAPLAPEVCEFFLALGYLVLEGYGLTEASPVVSVNRPDNLETGTVGLPLPDVEVKIAEDGEILVKGPNVMKGYWGDEESTKTAIDEEGWLYTGDVGVFTLKGNLKITDRKKNIFVSSGGKNIAPQPIENVLCQSPYIDQCVLIGDKREYITALITPDFEQLKVLADSFGIQYSIPSELVSNPNIIKVIKNDIDRLQKDFAKYERVRKFHLLSEPFTIENGELTPKLSIRRHVVERKFNDLIERMYGVE
ncbi:MAG: long-chain fatty acid--CoA ligase [Candidatus Kapabacteria bacterium]|nr:long-chain fatty acid--CoA ligase [Candidatus Kapabacteria bacterium]